ncbi:MAG: hypothetical protein J6A29_03705 [Clostridia bacterium]|nr:hypothetical protein [Clostridia bacterium]
MKNKLENKKEFYFGDMAIFIPIVFLITSILFMVVERKASLKTFWIGGFFSIFLTYLLAKDKKNFGKKCIKNLNSNTLLNCIVIFLLAGILSSVLKNSGISNAFLTFCMKVGVNAKFLPAIIFIICCVISTLIGTSTGTISMAVPIFLPLTATVNCNPALILGAIVSGSFFGDNLSPISDTTIISVSTMKVDLYETLKERAKVSLTCLVLSSLIYTILGHLLIADSAINITYNNYSLKPILMMLTFLLMIILLVRKNDMISVLLVCDVFAICISLVCGFINIGELFSQNSCIISGIEGVFGVIIFWIFLYILIGFIPEGIIERFIEKRVNTCNKDTKINFIAILTIILSVIMVSNNTAAMSIISKFIDKSFKNKTQIEKANIYDGLSCAVPGLLTYNTAFMLMVSLAYDTGCLPENFSVVSIMLFSVNSILLLVTYSIMALYNPKKHKDDSLIKQLEETYEAPEKVEEEEKTIIIQDIVNNIENK